MNWSVSQQQVFPRAFLICAIIAIILGVLLHKQNNKVKNIPFLIITVVLLVAEVVKQVRAIEIGYTFWSFPLHYCSTFLIWFTMASFFKGNTQKTGHAISYVTGFAFLIAFILNPSDIIGAATDNLALTINNFGSLHTFYYHFGVVLFLMLQITLRIPFPSLKNLKSIAIPFFSWMVIASIVANLTNTNFSNLLFNSVPFVDGIRIHFGYPIYLTSMFLIFFTLCLAILTLGSLLKLLKPQKKL